MKLSSGLVACALLTIAVPVAAQTLGDLAKKEAERRKALPPAAKTYTNDDLKKLPPTASEVGSKPAPEASGKGTDPVKPDGKSDAKTDGKTDGKADGKADAAPAKDEKYWRGRITAVREDIRRNEMFRDALQARINGLSADFAGRDDPYQRATIADDRQKALAELARVNSEIDKSTKLISDIEDEARRAGVPPGWLR